MLQTIRGSPVQKECAFVLLAWTIGALLRTRADEPPGMQEQPELLPDRALS